MKSKFIVTLLLLLATVLNLSGCVFSPQATNLMDGVTPQSPTFLNDVKDKNANAYDFAVRLFKATNENDKNTLVSPLSVLCALAMTANGANGETRKQMETVLGMSVEELNCYLYTYMNSLEQNEKCKLSLANSIWFQDSPNFNAKQDFLQTNANYYGADIYKTSFGKQTVDEINGWVNNKTDGMIPSLIDEIPDSALMYLINALAFEAEWSECYEKRDVKKGDFKKTDGTKQSVDFMYSTEYGYLNDGNAQGFIKYYSYSSYAFVALVPNENLSLEQYVSSLDGNRLSDLVSNVKSISVEAAIPKFEYEYSVKLSDTLKSMGMPIAFDDVNADFSGIGTSAGNIYIDEVLHKTYIQVAEMGTKAGAATAVAVNGGSFPTEGPKRVYLDRPFVYMLIDCKNKAPFLIGTVTDVA